MPDEQTSLDEINELSNISSDDARSRSVAQHPEQKVPAPKVGVQASERDPSSADTPTKSITPENVSPCTSQPTSIPPTPMMVPAPAMAARLRATTLDVPGLTRSKASPDGRISKRDVGAKLVIVMVGLPARGKSYVTKKLARFLNWQQHNCRIFNVGNTRRKANKTVGPATRPLPDGRGQTSHSADFFSPENRETLEQREKWAYDTLDELLDYVLDGDGSVGILDATNTTRARRHHVLETITKRSHGQLKVLFLESICTQTDIIDANVKLKLSGPDYRNMDREAAIADFIGRLRNYEKVYETIGPEEEADPRFQYIKMINVGQKMVCGNIQGFLASQTAFFLLNFNLDERQIWITRHGESTDNELGHIGGDASLTARGQRYAKALAGFIDHQKKVFRRKRLSQYKEYVRVLQGTKSRPATPLSEPQEIHFCVWTSMLRRAVETAEWFDEREFDIKEMRMLNEIDAGIFNGMSYEEIKSKYPDEYSARMKDKTHYRWPGVGGESYLDVVNRLRPVIVEMERLQDNCLVICHRVVARVLLAYFMNLGREAIGDLEVPLHTLYCLEPKPYGVDWALYKYNERTNWFYKVDREQVTVERQLSDQKRRYTVLPTLNVKLGDDCNREDEHMLDSDSDKEPVSSDTLSEAVARAL